MMQLRKQMDCQRGETDNRQQKQQQQQQQQHEEEAHGLKTCYIFDSPSQALPQPLLNLHPFDMPPQELTPPPGINNEKPWQTQHKEIQDPLKRFEIIERLGYGSSGSSIYKALDKSDNLKTIAIKKIPLSSLSDDCSEGDGSYNQQANVDYFVSCIADHTERWKVDDHQNNHYEEYKDDKRQNSHAKDITGLDKIVQCLGVYQTDKELWLSLEYCSGGSIEDLIRLSDGPLVESEVGWIMSQITQGLSFLHSKDHVHGDIKASNILFTADGNIKLGGSGSILTHKEGAGESKRRRRSLTMIEFPTSWLAPESNPSLPTTPCSTKQNQWIPNASASTDVWALGVACIELSQGKPPGPEMPILALFGERRLVGTPPAIPARRCDGSLGNMKWDNLQQQTETFGAASMGMSEEMWSFIARCLTPDPEARPNVQELLEDPLIVRYNTPSTEFLERIHRMMEFVDQCAMISSDLTPYEPSSSSSQSPPSSSLTLSPSKASYMVDMNIDESCVEPWKIPMVRPRVDSVYDASSFFDEAVSSWKHQRVSHPVVKQALLCEQAGYMIFRHSRSPSLATIVESQLEEDKEVNLGPLNDFMNSPIIVKKVGLGPLDDLVIDHGGVCGTM
ncbi:hypothetical protein BGZ46_002282 [Entomortierella lignicola]|nr:hypothetical protein BGZ46_002282 [Entomortierella lignicola]